MVFLISSVAGIASYPYASLYISSKWAVEGFTEALRVNLQRWIVYAQSAETSLQREVAEKLANEAVKRKLFEMLWRE